MQQSIKREEFDNKLDGLEGLAAIDDFEMGDRKVVKVQWSGSANDLYKAMEVDRSQVLISKEKTYSPPKGRRR